MKNTIKIIAFDLYNTLAKIDRPQGVFIKIYKASKNGFNISFKSYLRLIMTKDINIVFQKLPYEFEYLYSIFSPMLLSEIKSVSLYQDTIQTLNILRKDYQIFLISNLASPYKKIVFDNHLDQYFDKLFFSCDLGTLKPSQEIFQNVYQYTNSKPEEILRIGDSNKSDIIGAKQMGWQYLQIRHGIKPKENHQIMNLSEIVKFLN